MYSGQGSQYFRMGADLFENNHSFRSWFQQLDRIVQTQSGVSVRDVLYAPDATPGRPFDSLCYTHPAIFMVEYALTQVLLELGIRPDYCLGTSLGEYAALAAANVCDHAALLKLVMEQAELAEANCRKGGMLAIPEIFKNCECAADNFAAHFVVSGNPDAISGLELFLKKNSIICQRLPVNTAFHSSFIDDMESDFKLSAAAMNTHPSETPVISCAHKTINPQVTADYLWDVVRKPVYFRETLEILRGQDDFFYIDLGPSGTLAAFVNNGFHPIPKAFALLTLFGQNEKRLHQVQELLGA